MHKVTILTLWCVLIAFFGCSETINAPPSNAPPSIEGAVGQVTLLIPAHPANLSALSAVLVDSASDTVQTRFPFVDPNQSASLVIPNLHVGTWRLELRGYADADTASYAGTTSITIVTDSTRTLGVFFLSVTGEIEFVPEISLGCSTPAAGIVSLWPAEMTSYDAIDGNTATISPGVTYRPGRVGDAFHLDGLYATVGVADAPNLRITGSLSIEAWIYPETYPQGFPAGQLLFRGDDRVGLDPYYLAMMPEGTIRFHVGSLTAEVNIESEFPVPLDAWSHVAGVLDSVSGSMMVFVNGSIVAGTTTGVRPFRNLNIGSLPGIGIGNAQVVTSVWQNQPFHGLIDEMSIYDSPLSEQQVRNIYFAGKFGKCRNPGPTADSVVISLFAGGFSSPAGLCFDTAGRLLVAEFSTPGHLLSVTPEGIVDTFAPGAGWAISAVARDHAGNIYEAAQDGIVKRVPAGGGAPSNFISGLQNPAGIAIHPNGNIYVSDAAAQTVRMYDSSGAHLWNFWGGLNTPIGLAIDHQGRVYVADLYMNSIMIIEPDSTFSVFVSGILYPHDLTFDAAGTMYVSGGESPAGNNLYVVSPDGAVTELDHNFISPGGVAVDAEGNLYVANGGGGTVSKVRFVPRP